MSKVVIKAENISKQYRLGLVGTGTVKDDMKRWWYNLCGKEDPFLKIGEANDRSSKGESDYVWSLRDINFEINQGDSVGIIGRNGAGKSTLLKILSQVTQPTTGKIYTKGRIASLLEVGTGFHPEMTGRENIYLNGAILGMRKHEITKKFDEIVAFSGVERYIDTPVKRYSSGMYVRLAFAVAAHLESEILIVDEVLAVGDAEFQKKCLGKMNDVSKGEGRTVLFVSHDLSAISTITNKSILLSKGIVEGYSDTNKIISLYSNNESSGNVYVQEPVLDKPSVSKVKLNTSEGGIIQGYNKCLSIDFEIFMPEENIEKMALSFQILNHLQVPVLFDYIFDIQTEICRKKGINKLSFSYNNLSLYKGIYSLRVHLAETKTKIKFEEFDCCTFEVEMIDMKEPEWGWQKNVCQYLEKGNWDVL